MEVKRISIRQAKKRIKNDPELSKMLVRSGWREIALDLDGDGKPDVSFSSDTLGRKINCVAVDLDGKGEYNLYLYDYDQNGIPDTIIRIDEESEQEIIAFGGDVELGFINIAVKVANLLVAEDFMNKELGLSLADLAAYLEANAEIMMKEIEKRDNAVGIEKVYYYLNDARTYYLATVCEDKPKVRPFGTILLEDGKLYIQTGKSKEVSKQIGANPFVQICASMNDGTWLRIDAELAEDDNREIKEKMLAKMPQLKEMYSADDDNMQMFCLKDATAVFSSFTAEPETINF